HRVRARAVRGDARAGRAWRAGEVAERGRVAAARSGSAAATAGDGGADGGAEAGTGDRAERAGADGAPEDAPGGPRRFGGTNTAAARLGVPLREGQGGHLRRTDRDVRAGRAAGAAEVAGARREGRAAADGVGHAHLRALWTAALLTPLSPLLWSRRAGQRRKSKGQSGVKSACA